MARIILSLALLCLSVVPAAAQSTPATQAGLTAAGEMEKTLTKAGKQLADLKAILAAAPPCPVTVCPLCPPPVICPTCPPPVVCPNPPVDCVVSPWGEWSAWTPISATEESHTRSRTVVTPAANGGAVCPSLTESETRAIVVPSIPVVTDAAGLSAIMNACGDYRLAPGRYVGNFVRIATTCRWTLTGADTFTGRITPADVAGWSLVASDTTLPALTIATGTADVKVRGLTVTGVAADRTTAQVGSNLTADVTVQPKRVTLDQVAILAVNGVGHRGLEFHVADGTLTRSWIAGYMEIGRDSQAVWINNGPGPYTIRDNYLEASGENVLVGGDTVRIQNLVPADIDIDGNTLAKLQAWRTLGRSTKNTFELKCARRVTFRNNTLTGMWHDGQDAVIMLTPRNQLGDSPWCGVQDVTITGNAVREATDVFFAAILGHDNNFTSEQTARITFTGNYGDNVKGIQIIGSVVDYLKITNNTLPKIQGAVLSFDGEKPPVPTPFSFLKNVVRAGAYGIHGQYGGLDYYCAPGYSVQGNVIEQPTRTNWPYLAPNTNTFLVGDGLLAPRLDAEGHYVSDRTLGW